MWEDRDWDASDFGRLGPLVEANRQGALLLGSLDRLSRDASFLRA